jgi:hypothetical protein
MERRFAVSMRRDGMRSIGVERLPERASTERRTRFLGRSSSPWRSLPCCRRPTGRSTCRFVRADHTLVKIYSGTELIKVHQRQPRGGRSTDPNDYPPGKSEYALRDVKSLLGRAREKGAHVGTYAEKLLDGPLPWTRMRQAYALLRLCEKYGAGRVEAVCQSALAFDVVDVRRIGRMLQNAAKPGTPEPSGKKIVQLPLPRFARSQEHFVTRNPSGGKEQGQ